jgi:hypothetical protein
MRYAICEILGPRRAAGVPVQVLNPQDSRAIRGPGWARTRNHSSILRNGATTMGTGTMQVFARRGLHDEDEGWEERLFDRSDEEDEDEDADLLEDEDDDLLDDDDDDLDEEDEDFADDDDE